MRRLRYMQMGICLVMFLGELAMLGFALLCRTKVYTGTSLNLLFQNVSDIVMVVLAVIFFITLFYTIKHGKSNLTEDKWRAEHIVDLFVFAITAVGLIIAVNRVNKNVENGIISGNLSSNMNSSKLIFWLMCGASFSWFEFLAAKYMYPKADKG